MPRTRATRRSDGPAEAVAGELRLLVATHDNDDKPAGWQADPGVRPRAGWAGVPSAWLWDPDREQAL